MTKIEKHPAAEKLLTQITKEMINALTLGEENESSALLESGVGLITKAWMLPQEQADNSLALIQRQRELVKQGCSEAVLPDEQLLEPFDGPMIAELVWGLFETAVRLDDAQDRTAIHQIAIRLAEALSFDDWIEQSGPDGRRN